MQVSSQYTNLDATSTELLTNTGTYVNGEGFENDNITSSSITLSNQETEYEWCLMALGFHDGPAQNVANDTLDFRIYEGDDTALSTYDVTPRVTLTETAGYIGGTYVEHPNRLGPYIDGNGNLYTVIEHSTTANNVCMIKSTDGGDTWREMDAAGRPTQTDVEGLDIIQDGDTLHLLHVKTAVYYHSFTTSDHSTTPDEWVTIDESVDGTITGHTSQFGSIVKRSDGTLVAFYVDDAGPARVRYKIKSGGTWGSQNTLDTEASNDFISPSAVLGASDKSHVIYKDDTNGIIYHRSLSSSDSLGTRHSVQTGIATAGANDNIPYAPTIYWDSGGTEKIMTIYQKSATAVPVFHKVIADDGTPGSEVQASDNNVEQQEGGNTMVICSAAVDGSTVHFFYSLKGDYDIYRTSNADEGGWATDVEEQDAVTCHWIRGNVYNSGGNTVFGYLWDDGSNGGTGYVRYSEFVISFGLSVSASDAVSLSDSPSLLVFTPAVDLNVDRSALNLDNWKQGVKVVG